MASESACKPNYSRAGRRRRTQVAIVCALAAVAALVVLVALRWAWYTRLLLFFPASVAAGTWLQIRRDTCVSRARQGTFEHEDFSTTAANDEEARASRRVAASIYRDAILIGLASALLAAATALVY